MALCRLPQTLCHCDAFGRNLSARRTPDGLQQTVAIDWAIVGTGWIGQEVRMLVNSTILFHEVDYAEARELDHTVLEGYLDGLRDVGWHGDPRQARFGEVANSAVRPFAVLPLPGLMLGILLDESRHTWVERGVGLPIIEIADSMAELRRYPLLDWEREARELLDALF